ncbi:hypothetical protein V6U90_02145 [Micromonospora sp. CPCC 206060]|uniref:hypothetical protein n=1 Tax=Micromonospora sp. CPCC 206060 TaxID=3122406 RepID=UPI002FF12AF5
MHSNRSPHWGSGRDGAPARRIRPPRVAERQGLLARPPRDPARSSRWVPPDEPTGRRASTPVRRFTLHLGFEAGSMDHARERAVGYVEALSLLCPEVAPGAAALSTAENGRPERIFCGAVGPDDERCADVLGHPGFHHGPGVGSLGWGDGDSSGASG